MEIEIQNQFAVLVSNEKRNLICTFIANLGYGAFEIEGASLNEKATLADEAWEASDFDALIAGLEAAKQKWIELGGK